jgi:hypothetical protein
MQSEASFLKLFGGVFPSNAKLYVVAAVPLEDLPSITATQGLASSKSPATPAVADDGPPASLNPADTAKLDRLVYALMKTPLNEPRSIVLKLLKATAEGEWLPFPKMWEAIEKSGIAKDTHEAIERGAAALREFSWQIKQYMPAADLVGHKSPIEVFATRARVGKETRYRLTAIGRAAITHIIKG